MSHGATAEHSEHHHVHFDTTSLKDDFESDSCVTYQKSGDAVIVSLGFLQINHRYLVDLKLPASYFADFTKVNELQPDINSIPNLHCRITEFTGTQKNDHDFFDMKIEFFAYKEKLLKETLTIFNPKHTQDKLKLIIAARVLGTGKGTPMLRNGIHCIGVDKDTDESESSDFAGFGKGN